MEHHQQNNEAKILILIKAKQPATLVITHELKRVHGFINDCVRKLKEESDIDTKWYSWNNIDGIKIFDNDSASLKEYATDDTDSGSIIEKFLQSDEFKNSILILENFHFEIENNPKNIQRIKNVCERELKDRFLILQQPTLFLPTELEKDIQVVDVEYPSVADLYVIYEQVSEQYKLEVEKIEAIDKLLESLLGLTIMEANIALKKAAVIKGALDDSCIQIILELKEQIIKKSGYLEYYHPMESLDDVGGLENLKSWIRKRGNSYSKGAKDYGLEYPKGILLLGVAGTGKSLSAKAVSSEWQFPLLRLDMGKIFGGIVGESERNIRNALGIAEALSPSILWIDEIEKGLSGSSSSSQTDGGVTSRILGTFLTWMQEKKKPVFVIATANDISKLPPELLRKGRVDEIFFVDLPGDKSREDIIKIHLKSKGRNIKNFDIKEITKVSNGYTGAEIEEAVKEAMFTAFDEGEQLTTKHIIDAIKRTFPISQTMQETINDLRKWAKSRAVLASSEEVILDTKSSIEVPTLKQEQSNNPFINKRN